MDVLAQNTAVLRYAAHLILTKRAQKNASFSGISVYVLAHLQLSVKQKNYIHEYSNHEHFAIRLGAMSKDE